MALLLAALGGVLRHKSDHRPDAAVAPAPTTSVHAPSAGVASPPVAGTKVLTEPVDPAQIAVPEGWESISTDARTLPTLLRSLEKDHPSLVSELRVEELAATAGGIRIFAMKSSRPVTFVSLTSSASPGVPPVDQHIISTYQPVVKRSRGTVTEIRAIQLPAGGAFEATITTSTKTMHSAAQYELLVIGGRTIQVSMATDDALVPPVFAAIARSLRVG